MESPATSQIARGRESIVNSKNVKLYEIRSLPFNFSPDEECQRST